ncbi:hypothetical protein GCM10027176_29030 [Actinoallomurus bryophytorum]
MLCLAVLAGSVGTAACRSDADPPRTAGTPSTSASSGSPVATPSRSPACPSAREFIKAMDARGWPHYKVTRRIVCDGGWATTTVEVTTVVADPARAVARLVGGRWHAVIFGTDGLCEAPGMRPAPAGIRKALGPYC